MKTKIKRKKPTLTQLRCAFEKATKMSQILAIGLHDLRTAERSKKYTVNMYNWCKPQSDGTCIVCLAGSVMAGRYPKMVKDVVDAKRAEDAKRFELSPYDKVWIGIDEAKIKFRILNCLRNGNVLNAFDLLGTYLSTDMDREVHEYDAENPKPWWTDMRQLLKDLRAAGL